MSEQFEVGQRVKLKKNIYQRSYDDHFNPGKEAIVVEIDELDEELIIAKLVEPVSGLEDRAWAFEASELEAV